MADRQTKACACIGVVDHAIDHIERFEDLAQLRSRNAYSGVDNADVKTQFSVTSHLHRAVQINTSVLRKFNGIAKQVGDDLLELYRIAPHLLFSTCINTQAKAQLLLASQA